ncbi:hypothetical protein Poly51_53750 [Rubripirellula tenax]|uniref:Uncharacterized protein n=1 Tax=Rubripirellula tenax TaxID=2528015 RepID=A0A5C6EGK9_9BACT|nr:hypothetical protein Poly51_53750 [Rubripirellula tenax]
MIKSAYRRKSSFRSGGFRPRYHCTGIERTKQTSERRTLMGYERFYFRDLGDVFAFDQRSRLS